MTRSKNRPTTEVNNIKRTHCLLPILYTAASDLFVYWLTEQTWGGGVPISTTIWIRCWKDSPNTRYLAAMWIRYKNDSLKIRNLTTKWRRCMTPKKPVTHTQGLVAYQTLNKNMKRCIWRTTQFQFQSFLKCYDFPLFITEQLLNNIIFWRICRMLHCFLMQPLQQSSIVFQHLSRTMNMMYYTVYCRLDFPLQGTG
jgi:hypothetical protein